MMQKEHVVALDVMHRAAHARITFAKAQIVRRVVFGRFACCPVPVAAVLQIHDVNRVAAHYPAVGLQPEVVDATQTSSLSTAAPNQRKSIPAARPMAAPLNIGWFEMMS